MDRDGRSLTGASRQQEPRGVPSNTQHMEGGVTSGGRDGEAEPGSFQARIEATTVGRIVISAVIAVILVAVVVNNLPESELQRTVEPAFEPLLEGAALSQTWNLFAPTPRHISRELEARLLYDDGNELRWRPPEGDRLIGSYRDYRWKKWGRDVTLTSARHQWPATARWIAENHRRNGRLPSEVILVRRFYHDPPAGSGAEQPPPWRELEVFRVRYERSGDRT